MPPGCRRDTSDTWDTFKSPAAASEISAIRPVAAREPLVQRTLRALERSPPGSRQAPIDRDRVRTFEFWWLREGASFGTVNDAHSFYLELAAETGIAGLLLGLAFVLALFTAGWRALRLSTEARTALAAALAALAAFCFSAAVDWVWELAVIPITAMLLAGVAFGVGRDPAPAGPPDRLRRGLVISIAALAPIGLIALVLSSATSIEESRASVRAGSLSTALEHAMDAHEIEPGAATPLLQAALVRELGRSLRRHRCGSRRHGQGAQQLARMARPLAPRGSERTSGRSGARLPARADLNPNHPVFRR